MSSACPHAVMACTFSSITASDPGHCRRARGAPPQCSEHILLDELTMVSQAIATKLGVPHNAVSMRLDELTTVPITDEQRGAHE
eukprot:993025-Pelagomonas_calceolata.AAC.1